MFEFLRTLFKTENFMPHGHCYLWLPDILWLHVISDAVIGLAYASIPFALIYLVRKRKDLAFNWVFIMFGIFIMACGATHFIAIWTVWEPVYGFQGIVKAVTALASLGTALALWPLLPKILVLPSPAQLEKANRGLHLEIAERKRAEDALAERNKRLLEAERLKGEFIANVSHELRTPLTLILAPIESLLNEACNLDSGQRKTLQTVHNNAIRLLQMVNGLLDFSKLEANKVQVKREAVDIIHLTRSILADFEPAMKTKGIEGRFDSLKAQLPVRMDRYLYERILFNLLSNAVKFTPNGGTVDVTLRYEDNGQMKVVVSDTGCGISEDHQKHLFKKFRQLEGSSTRRFEGTGIGLSLVKQFSELLGGGVRVESDVGQGCAFVVDLEAPSAAMEPAAKHQAEAALLVPIETLAADVPEVASPNEKLPTVLLAEDNQELASYIRYTLKDTCRVEVVANGKAGLEAVHKRIPDLVITDLMMPDMDGYSFCRKLKGLDQTSSVPVVMLTALAHREALLKGWEAGADEYLFKPFHPTELITRIRSLLNAKEAQKRAEQHLLELVREQAIREVAEANIKRLERIHEELRRANRVKDEFLGIVSHELRTPMNAILGWSQLLLNGDLPPEEHKEAFGILYRNARCQARIIDDVLDISKIVTGQLQLNVSPVDMGHVVKAAVDSVTLAARAKNIDLKLSIGESIQMIAGDEDRLRQVVWNLVSNAVKFTGAGGTVIVVVERRSRNVYLRVQDTGIGIEPQFLDHVFERFLQEDTSSTRPYGELGLGLSIVKHIVELHGGMVRAESLGKEMGAAFTVFLPTTAETSSESFQLRDRAAPVGRTEAAPVSHPSVGQRLFVE